MKKQNIETRTNRAFNEVEKVRDKLTSVYVITKNGEKKGLISNRWTTYPHWNKDMFVIESKFYYDKLWYLEFFDPSRLTIEEVYKNYLRNSGCGLSELRVRCVNWATYCKKH